MSERDLREIENGTRQPRLEEVLLLAFFLRTTVEYLERGGEQKAMGPQEMYYARLFLGTPRHKIRQQLARYHNNH